MKDALRSRLQEAGLNKGVINKLAQRYQNDEELEAALAQLAAFVAAKDTARLYNALLQHRGKNKYNNPLVNSGKTKGH